MIRTRDSILGLAVLGMASSLTLAQTGPQLLIEPFRAETRFDGTASATYFFDTDADFGSVAGEDVDAQLARYSVAARYRLVEPAAKGTQPTMIQRADPRLGFSLNYLTVDTDNDVLPESFTDVQIGASTGIAAFDGWVAGLTFGMGWAGANEFGDSDAYFGTATLLFGRKLDENTSLALALDYNGNRSFLPDVPLPGIVWTREIPEQKLEVSLGIPFAYGRWRPIEPLLLEVNFTFPDFVGARASYDLVEGVGLFASFAQRTDAWHSQDLDNDVDRILFEQTLAEVGARFSIRDEFVLLIAGGYAFGQEFRYGFDSRDTEEILEIDDGPFVRIEGQFSF